MLSEMGRWFLFTVWLTLMTITICSIVEVSVLKIAKKLLESYFELKMEHLRKISTEFDESERRSTFRAGLH